MIVCNLQGGFGNHLFCYFLGCIMAEKFKNKIYIKGNTIANDQFKQRKDTRETIYKIINPIYISQTNNSIAKNIIHINTIEQYNNILNNSHDLNEIIININIVSVPIPFYVKNIDIIKKYVIINNIKNTNTIVVSLRLGMGANEVVQPSPFEKDLRLPFTYYIKAINYFLEKNMCIDKLLICSDNYNDNYLKNFNEYYKHLNIIFCDDKNTLEQFEYIVNADYFVSSNSSFSLVGAVLNTTGICTIPNFNESDTIYPCETNKIYSEFYNVNSDNCIKISI
jgi:hypothetical protein